MKLFPGHDMLDAHVAHSSWGRLRKTCRRAIQLTFQYAGERLQRPHQATFLWVCATEVAHTCAHVGSTNWTQGSINSKEGPMKPGEKENGRPWQSVGWGG